MVDRRRYQRGQPVSALRIAATASTKAAHRPGLAFPTMMTRITASASRISAIMGQVDARARVVSRGGPR